MSKIKQIKRALLDIEEAEIDLQVSAEVGNTWDSESMMAQSAKLKKARLCIEGAINKAILILEN